MRCERVLNELHRRGFLDTYVIDLKVGFTDARQGSKDYRLMERVSATRRGELVISRL